MCARQVSRDEATNAIDMGQNSFGVTGRFSMSFAG
jgi:hypothetical protein